MRKLVLAIVAVWSLASTSIAAAQRHSDGCWATVWEAAPQKPVDPDLYPDGGMVFDNVTVRQFLRVSNSTRKLRITVSNLFGKTPLRIGGARFDSLLDRSRTVIGGSVPITFRGKTGVTLAPGSSFESDSVPVDMLAGATVSVSLYFPSTSARPSTVHLVGMAQPQIATGNQLGVARLSSSSNSTSRYFLTRIDACSLEQRKTVVTLGDSQTNGTNSTLGADNRYPDALARRIVAAGLPLTVANAGIDGNRLLHDHWGPSTLVRLKRDVLSVPNVEYVILLQGINDIYAPYYLRRDRELVSSARIISAYRKVISRLHAKGISIAICTLLPNSGADRFYKGYHSAAGEHERQQVNAWIRRQTLTNAVFDYDVAIRDPAHPERMLDAFDSGDHLHPNDAGYKRIASTVNLRFFTQSGSHLP